MIPGSEEGGYRFFCGRVRKRRPFYAWLFDHLGLHQELYRVVGKMGIYRRWVESKAPGRSIYTCRKPRNHWKVTLKPQGLRWVTAVHDRNFTQAGVDEANRLGIKNRDTPYWRERIGRPTRTTERIQIPTEAWELGHRYEFTRWQELE